MLLRLRSVYTVSERKCFRFARKEKTRLTCYTFPLIICTFPAGPKLQRYSVNRPLLHNLTLKSNWKFFLKTADSDNKYVTKLVKKHWHDRLHMTVFTRARFSRPMRLSKHRPSSSTLGFDPPHWLSGTRNVSVSMHDKEINGSLKGVA